MVLPRGFGDLHLDRGPIGLLTARVSNKDTTLYSVFFCSLPQLVELKNGETYNGHLVSCDTWMNINLREVICTSKVG